MKSFDGLCIIPDVIIQCKEKLGEIDWKATFKKFCESYQDNFPNYTEIYFFESYWKCYNIPYEIKTTLKTISFPGFQNTQKAFKICSNASYILFM